MKKYLIILFLLIGGFAAAQDYGIIEGIILDKELNNEPLAFANVKIKETKQNVSSNIDGAYVLELQPGTYTLIINFPGYEKIEVPNIFVEANKITSIEDKQLGTLQTPSNPVASSSKEK